MRKNNQTSWFPAKRYGWGWGPPNAWQGWMVMAIYVLLLAIVAVYFLRHDRVAAFVVATTALTTALVFMCWLKGEKPEWRWGK